MTLYIWEMNQGALRSTKVTNLPLTDKLILFCTRLPGIQERIFIKLSASFSASFFFGSKVFKVHHHIMMSLKVMYTAGQRSAAKLNIVGTY
jgi:hypothetical protein